MNVQKAITFLELSTVEEVYQFLMDFTVQNKTQSRMTTGVAQILTHRKVMQCISKLHNNRTDPAVQRLFMLFHGLFFITITHNLNGNNDFRPAFRVVCDAIRRDRNTKHAKWMWWLMFVDMSKHQMYDPNDPFHLSEGMIDVFIDGNVVIPSKFINRMIKGLGTRRQYGHTITQGFNIPYVRYLTEQGIVFPNLTQVVPRRSKDMSEERRQLIENRRNMYGALGIKWDQSTRKQKSFVPWVQYVLNVQYGEDRASQEITRMRSAFDDLSQDGTADVYPHVQSVIAGYIRPETLDRYPDYESRQRGAERNRDRSRGGSTSSKRRK